MIGKEPELSFLEFVALRGVDGRWNAPVFVARDRVLEFTPLAIAITLDKIYQNTSLT